MIIFIKAYTKTSLKNEWTNEKSLGIKYNRECKKYENLRNSQIRFD